MQLKSNLNHVFTSFSTKQTNNYRIFCGNKQIQSKYIYRFYDIIISPSHHPQPSQKHRHPCAQSNPPKTALSLAMHYILGSLVKGEVLSPEKIRATTGGIAVLPSIARTQLPQHKKSAIRVNSGFFIFNSQHSSKWCPVVKHNALTAPTANTATAFSALSLENCQHPASLVKGRWIDGKAQTVALLLSACNMPTIFILQIFLPSRRRDCSQSAQLF